MMSKMALIFLGFLALTGEATNQRKLEKMDSKSICDLTGICQGFQIGVDKNLSKDECLSLCHDEKSCNWWSFTEMESSCKIFEHCHELDESYVKYVSGQVGCYRETLSTILISTGYSGNSATQTTEVINIEDDSKCQDVEDFPLAIESAVGSYLGSFPVICGGYKSSSLPYKSCHRLESGKWQPFATLGQRRNGAAGIVHANTFIIFGGYDDTGSGLLSTTEIVTEEGQVTPGPEMPAAVFYHSISSLNATTSILTGGYTSATSSSDVTWYFDHVSQEFQQGPPLITGRKWHSSATLQDHDTKEDIVAVVGGYNRGALDSAEFLRNGEWTAGPKMPKKLRGLSAVVLGGDLYAIGGLDENDDDQTAIHRLSCSSGNCAWTTMDEELTVGRAGQVSFAVPNNQCMP